MSRQDRRRHRPATKLFRRVALWGGCAVLAWMTWHVRPVWQHRTMARQPRATSPATLATRAPDGPVFWESSTPTNILLIANNARHASHPLSMGTAGGQADIILVAHVDLPKHRVTLISIPRDTMVAMPTWRVPIPKIKSVFTVGLQQAPNRGPELMMKSVSRLLGLSVDHYVVTNFQGFVDAVDAVGGVPIHVQERIYDPLHSGANLQPGNHVLNGNDTLAFVRVRQNQAGNGYRVNDFQRQQAEMDVLRVLKERLLHAKSHPGQLIQLVRTWHRDVATDLTVTQLLSLARHVSSASLNTIQLGSLSDSMNLASASLAGANAQNYITGAYYDVLDPKEIKQKLCEIGSTQPITGLPTMPRPSDVPVGVWGPSSIVQQLKAAGFQTSYQGFSPRYHGRQITVAYPRGHIAWGWAVARALGTSNAWVVPSRGQQVVVRVN